MIQAEFNSDTRKRRNMRNILWDTTTWGYLYPHHLIWKCITLYWNMQLCSAAVLQCCTINICRLHYTLTLISDSCTSVRARPISDKITSSFEEKNIIVMYINTAKMHVSSERIGANSRIEICLSLGLLWITCNKMSINCLTWITSN